MSDGESNSFILEMFQLSNGTSVQKKPHIHHFMSISHLLKENDTLEIYTARSYLMYNLNKENVVGPIATVLMITRNCSLWRIVKKGQKKIHLSSVLQIMVSVIFL